MYSLKPVCRVFKRERGDSHIPLAKGAGIFRDAVSDHRPAIGRIGKRKMQTLDRVRSTGAGIFDGPPSHPVCRAVAESGVVVIQVEPLGPHCFGQVGLDPKSISSAREALRANQDAIPMRNRGPNTLPTLLSYSPATPSHGRSAIQIGFSIDPRSLVNMSRPSVATQRNLTLTEELEKLEQSITLTLQGSARARTMVRSAAY